MQTFDGVIERLPREGILTPEGAFRMRVIKQFAFEDSGFGWSPKTNYTRAH
jgi:hypothetical protein